jgi:hypothetical protein
MKAEKLSTEIAALERQSSKAKNAVLKKVLAKKIDKLKTELESITSEETAKDKIKKAKTKVNAMDAKEFNAYIKELAKNPDFSFLKSMTSSEIVRDMKRTAKPVGWRFRGRKNAKTPTKKDIKEKNNVYYEGRRNRSDVSRKIRLKDGGGVDDEGIDLFEDYEDIPQNLQNILDKYMQKFDDDFGNMDYNDMADMHDEVYEIGYTFESGLDNQPYDLRPIGTKGKSEVEEYKNGGGVEYYKNSTIRKGTFGDDDFNPMDLPVTYRVYDENGKVLGKTTSANNAVYLRHKLGLNYKTKIVATDKSGNERVTQDGVNSKGEQYAGGGGVGEFPKEGEIILPKDIDYNMMDYLSRTNKKLLVTLKNGENVKSSVGKFYNNLIFHGKLPSNIEYSPYSIQKQQFEKVQILDSDEMAKGGGVDINDWDMPVIRTQFEDEEFEYAKGGETGEPHRTKMKNMMKEGGKTDNYYKHKITMTDKFDNVYDVALFRGKGDALIALNALDKDKKSDLFYELKQN